jgi:hypothetical protein
VRNKKGGDQLPIAKKQKCIWLTEKSNDKLSEMAEKEGQSLSAVVEGLIKNFKRRCPKCKSKIQ